MISFEFLFICGTDTGDKSAEGVTFVIKIEILQRNCDTLFLHILQNCHYTVKKRAGYLSWVAGDVPERGCRH